MSKTRVLLVPAVAVVGCTLLITTLGSALPLWAQACLGGAAAGLAIFAFRSRGTQSKADDPSDLAIRARVFNDTVVLALILWAATIVEVPVDPKILTFAFLAIVLLDYAVRRGRTQASDRSHGCERPSTQQHVAEGSTQVSVG